ncbi:MAG: KH domain-containing protein [Myxococcales bacterium]|nr:KH domain-containing protein [Myxococcales bacterium]
MSDKSEAAELVTFIAKSLVGDVDAVDVVEVDDGRTLELETSADDRGRVIGRQGRVAKAMRAVLAASSVGANHRLEIVD